MRFGGILARLRAIEMAYERGLFKEKLARYQYCKKSEISDKKTIKGLERKKEKEKERKKRKRKKKVWK